MEGRGVDLSGSVKVQVAGCCEQGTETSVYVKRQDFIDWTKNCYVH